MVDRRGILFGVAAYVMWGIFPLYFPLLKPAGPSEILAQRIIWSLVAVLMMLAVRRHWSWVRDLVRQPKKLGLLALAAVVITVNWGIFIYAVNSGRTLEASLGYFINPLLSVVFGVVIFRERLRRWQWVAVGLGALSVVVLTIGYGRLPWIALLLAGSFGTYGLVKKFVNMPSAESLATETFIIFLPALAYAVYVQLQGTADFGHHGAGHALLIVGTGLVTAVPLMLFNASAIRIPMSTLGMLQYLAPVLQFLIGLLVQHETMPASRWAGFLLVWAALITLSVNGLRTAHRNRGNVPAPLPEPALQQG
ncbi:MAG: chloramphenicol-sensitive protein RarD [Streptosporangiaceae bacterium]|jgi:chloramphenicol-sensitive protein RarD|nr:RarD protein superfamily transporter [Streptosporangiaceae bacterium]MDX6428091.1 chloramphenicol-sensitive protein RarD [Streptosporangiaceae bacterium]